MCILLQTQSTAGYTLEAVYELLRYLSALVDPQSHNNTQIMIQVGLEMLDIVLETCIHEIAHYTHLFNLLSNNVCFSLLSLLTCEHNMLFSSALHLLTVIFVSQHALLKPQFHWFLQLLVSVSSGCVLDGSHCSN
jgi:hypothetical protein